MSSKNDRKPLKRRDFLVLTSLSVGAVAIGSAVYPLVSSMRPAKDVLAQANVEVDISGIQPGQVITCKWRGKPVFIRRRTEAELSDVRSVKMSILKDPERDEDRVKQGKDEWLVVVGVCTHLGCIPISNSGAYNGWFCPCHGSDYDASGRIRKGPAPQNLEVPLYTFVSDSVLLIGSETTA